MAGVDDIMKDDDDDEDDDDDLDSDDENFASKVTCSQKAKGRR
jgi:hypothetical protein